MAAAREDGAPEVNSTPPVESHILKGSGCIHSSVAGCTPTRPQIFRRVPPQARPEGAADPSIHRVGGTPQLRGGVVGHERTGASGPCDAPEKKVVRS